MIVVVEILFLVNALLYEGRQGSTLLQRGVQHAFHPHRGLHEIRPGLPSPAGHLPHRCRAHISFLPGEPQFII